MTNEEVFVEAARVINGLGWHEEVLVSDTVLLTELVALGDAVGSFVQAERMNERHEAGQCLADCMLRLLSVAVRAGFSPREIARQRGPASTPVVVAYGALCHAVLLGGSNKIDWAIRGLADSIWTTASQPRVNANLISVMHSKFGEAK